MVSQGSDRMRWPALRAADREADRGREQGRGGDDRAGAARPGQGLHPLRQLLEELLDPIVAVLDALPAHFDPKTALPNSHATTQAIGTSSDGSCRTTNVYVVATASCCVSQVCSSVVHALHDANTSFAFVSRACRYCSNVVVKYGVSGSAPPIFEGNTRLRTTIP